MATTLKLKDNVIYGDHIVFNRYAKNNVCVERDVKNNIKEKHVIITKDMKSDYGYGTISADLLNNLEDLARTSYRASNIIKEIYEVHNKTKNGEGEHLNTYIVFEKFTMVVSRDPIMEKTDSRFIIEDGIVCYPFAIIPNEFYIMNFIFNRKCYFTNKSGDKYKDGRHYFVVGTTRNTIVIHKSDNKAMITRKNIAEDAYNEMEVGKYLLAKCNNLSAEEAKEKIVHHIGCHWDETRIKLMDEDEHSQWHAENKEIHRIEVQIATLEELEWFTTFITNSDKKYESICNGEISVVRNNKQKWPNEAKVSYYKAEMIDYYTYKKLISAILDKGYSIYKTFYAGEDAFLRPKKQK